MATVRIHIRVNSLEPIQESLSGTFEVNASGCVDVYRILRDRIHEMAPAVPATDPFIDNGG